MFDQLAHGYDFFNLCASFGLDKVWRKNLVLSILKCTERKVLLDVGSGTGDLIFDLLKYEKIPTDLSLIGMDLSIPMLQKAEAKSWGKQSSSMIQFIQGNSQFIPVQSEHIDCVMSAFVLRNIKKIIYNTFQEIYRVLKPGGSVFLLDMYVPSNPGLKLAHKIYLKTVLPAIGYSIFGKRWSGSYLPETIENFCSPSQITEYLKNAQFKNIETKFLSGGMAVLHIARKH